MPLAAIGRISFVGHRQRKISRGRLAGGIPEAYRRRHFLATTVLPLVKGHVARYLPARKHEERPFRIFIPGLIYHRRIVDTGLQLYVQHSLPPAALPVRRT